MRSFIKICIVGAGSSYTPELIEGILEQDSIELPIKCINLHDIDNRRLKIMADLSKRMIAKKNSDIEVNSSTKLEEMVKDCDFIVTQIRVGGMDARYFDESIPLKYGIIGQETTGPGGMFKAVRTILPMLEIAKTVERYAPEAFILNYTNPSGIITEAVTKHTKAKIIGLCSIIPMLQEKLSLYLGDKYKDLKSYCVGLNHLGIIHKIISNGSDVTKKAVEYLYNEKKLGSVMYVDEDREFIEISKMMNGALNPYLRYFFLRGRELEKEISSDKTRAQIIMEIEKDIFIEAEDPKTDKKPLALEKRGGKGYSDVTFSVMSAIYNNTGAEIVSIVKNNGTVEGIDDDASVEIVCRMDKNGATPLPVGKIPLQIRGIIQSVKAYESLTVEAVIKKDKNILKEALINHPLGGDMDIIEPLIDEMIKALKIDFFK